MLIFCLFDKLLRIIRNMFIFSRWSGIHRWRRDTRIWITDSCWFDGWGDIGWKQCIREISGNRPGDTSLAADHSGYFRSLSKKITRLREENGFVHSATRAIEYQRSEQSSKREAHQLPCNRMRKVKCNDHRFVFLKLERKIGKLNSCNWTKLDETKVF